MRSKKYNGWLKNVLSPELRKCIAIRQYSERTDNSSKERDTHTRRNPRERERDRGPRVKEGGKDGCSGAAALLLMCLRCVRQDYNSNSLGCGNSIIIINIFFVVCCLQEVETAILAMWWCGEIVMARESGGGGRSKMACRDGEEEEEEEKGDDDGVGATRSRSGSRNGPWWREDD